MDPVASAIPPTKPKSGGGLLFHRHSRLLSRPAVAHFYADLRRKRFRYESLYSCWSAGRIFNRPRRDWLRQMLTLALPRRNCSRNFLFRRGGGRTYSSQLKSLVDSKSMFWAASGNLAQTIFDAGWLCNNVRLSEAQKQEYVLAYQRAIQQAFASVSDALIGLQKYRKYREQEARVAAAAEDATRLARLRYSAGLTNYL